MIYNLLFVGMAFLKGMVSGKENMQNFFFILILLFLYIFVAFRFQVGCDWSGYFVHYLSYGYLGESQSYWTSEPAYHFILEFVKSSDMDYPYLNVFMAIPFFMGFAYLAWRQPDPLGFLVLSFPVLIINMPMSALRQAAGIGMICIAMVAFQDKKFLKYILFVLLAGLFHKSALIFIAMAPFIIFPISRLTISVAVILVLPGIYFMLSDVFSIYSDRYIGTGVDALGGIFRAGMLALTGAYFLLFLRKQFALKYPAEYPMVLVSVMIMLITLPTVAISSVIADRFGYYITPIQLVILARIPYLIEGRSKMFDSAVPYLGLALVLAVWTSKSSHFNECYLPYQNWLVW